MSHNDEEEKEYSDTVDESGTRTVILNGVVYTIADPVKALDKRISDLENT